MARGSLKYRVLKNARLGVLIQLTPNWKIPSGMWVKFHNIARREEDSEEFPEDIPLHWPPYSPPSHAPSPLPNPTPASYTPPPDTLRMHLLSREAPQTPALPNTSVTHVLSPLRSCWGLSLNFQRKILGL